MTSGQKRYHGDTEDTEKFQPETVGWKGNGCRFRFDFTVRSVSPWFIWFSKSRESQN